MSNGYLILSALAGLFGIIFFIFGLLLFLMRKDMLDQCQEKHKGEGDFTLRDLIAFIEENEIDLRIIPGSLCIGVRHLETTFRLSMMEIFTQKLHYHQQFVVSRTELEHILYLESYIRRMFEISLTRLKAQRSENGNE